jgi:hypothetical protein
MSSSFFRLFFESLKKVPQLLSNIRASHTRGVIMYIHLFGKKIAN